MHETSRDAIVSLAAFAAVFGLVYVFLMTRHRERMTMLEHNVLGSPFPTSNVNNLTLKCGMLLVGVGIAFLTIYTIEACGIHSDGINVAVVCLFGGISLIASYIIVEKKNKEKLK